MFGFTIHKSQGMDILYLEIDCKFARLPGLTEIAVGKAITIDGLHVLNF